ncbi:MAG TPA: hypothetical protein VFW71_00535 [Actinomycetota bacterium]|nr:hypothetical protein [Actinomycetota bacterium]
MPVIRVNPDSIRQYAAAAQGQFDAVRSELVGLVDDAVGVRYFGPNAVDFKSHCGQMAADFSLRLGQDLGHIADAVRAATSAVSASLGGAPISIAVNGAALPVPPVPRGDGSVEIDPTGLEALKPVVTRHISAIVDQISAHLRTLQGTDWEGQAKQSAVSAVSGFTSAAQSRANEAQTSITSYIDAQISDVMARDR